MVLSYNREHAQPCSEPLSLNKGYSRKKTSIEFGTFRGCLENLLSQENNKAVCDECERKTDASGYSKILDGAGMVVFIIEKGVFYCCD